MDVTAFPQDRQEVRTGETLLALATEGQASDERRASNREATLAMSSCFSLGCNATACGRLIKNVIRARKVKIVNEPKKQKNTYIGKRGREEGG